MGLQDFPDKTGRDSTVHAAEELLALLFTEGAAARTCVRRALVEADSKSDSKRCGSKQSEPHKDLWGEERAKFASASGDSSRARACRLVDRDNRMRRVKRVVLRGSFRAPCVSSCC